MEKIKLFIYIFKNFNQLIGITKKVNLDDPTEADYQDISIGRWIRFKENFNPNFVGMMSKDDECLLGQYATFNTSSSGVLKGTQHLDKVNLMAEIVVNSYNHGTTVRKYLDALIEKEKETSQL